MYLCSPTEGQLGKIFLGFSVQCHCKVAAVHYFCGCFSLVAQHGAATEKFPRAAPGQFRCNQAAKGNLLGGDPVNSH